MVKKTFNRKVTFLLIFNKFLERKMAEELKRKMRGGTDMDGEDDIQTEVLEGEAIEEGLCSTEYSSRKISLDQLFKHSQQDINHIKSIVMGCSESNEGDESDDEFYDAREIPEDIRSLTKWNSMELVPDAVDPYELVGHTASPDLRRSVKEPCFKELRRTVSYRAESSTKWKNEHPSIELAEVAEPTCSTSVLILVVHGGSILDPVTDLAVKKSDVTIFQGTFESIMSQHYPGMVGHLVMKCVPCPNICGDTLAVLSSLSPYSCNTSLPMQNNDQLPIGIISLFATAAPEYQQAVTEMVAQANSVYQNFLESEEGFGFCGQVCLIGDSVGAILSYDALCRRITRSRSENSNNEEDHAFLDLGCPSKRNPDLLKISQDQCNQDPQKLPDQAYLGFDITDKGDFQETFQFDVSELFMFGSPLALVLAYRKANSNNQNSSLDLPNPNCNEIYNLFHPGNPIAARLEPLLSPSFSKVPPLNIPRYKMYPLGDGQTINLSNTDIFSQSESSMFYPQAQTIMKSKLFGRKRIDFALFCPEGLVNFPSNSLPHLFHASYWESADVISFILRQLNQKDDWELTSSSERGLQSFVPNQAREKWIKKRTTVKIRNGTANHRANDVIVLEGKEQFLHGRFSYGPFDMVLSSEKVDIHIMRNPPHREWTFLATELTDKNGRITYKIPATDRPGYGVYPVKMVVRGDHTGLGLRLAVVPPQTEAVVFSIDGSFTVSVSVTGKDPKVRPSSVDVVRHWQDLGFLIIYVTGRPCMQNRKVISWLTMHNFPYGLVSFADGFSTDPLGHKREYLQQLQQEHNIVIHSGYGSSKDISVYTSLGVKQKNINIVGKVSRKQLPLCNHLSEGYAAHLASLTAPGASRPAQGNVRIVIPTTCFGLPDQIPVNIRRQSLLASSKKYSSLPASALPVARTDTARMGRTSFL